MELGKITSKNECNPSISQNILLFMTASQEISDKDLCRLFDDAFYRDYNTRLLGGGQEPEYIPANQQVNHHRIIFTQDYIASALHEVAHWCIAGVQRRLQHDYGYWYIPDGRTESEQANFEVVESKTQALEWIFTQAIGRRFRISTDNLNNSNTHSSGPSEGFKRNIVSFAKHYCASGLNQRAMTWVNVLVCAYGRDVTISECLAFKHYDLDELN